MGVPYAVNAISSSVPSLSRAESQRREGWVSVRDSCGKNTGGLGEALLTSERLLTLSEEVLS
jgi:hypothetical protein